MGETVRELPTADWQEAKLPARAVERVRLVFRELAAKKDAASSLRDLRIIANQPFTAGEAAPYWQGYWIWYPDGGMNNVTRYFRKTFVVTNPKELVFARLQVALAPPRNR